MPKEALTQESPTLVQERANNERPGIYAGASKADAKGKPAAVGDIRRAMMTEEKLRDALEFIGFFTSIHNKPVVAVRVDDALSVIAPVLAFKDDEISALVQELNKNTNKIRNAALEEAAKVAESRLGGWAIGVAIRALISKE